MASRHALHLALVKVWRKQPPETFGVSLGEPCASALIAEGFLCYAPRNETSRAKSVRLTDKGHVAVARGYV